jgi:dTMP kinase
MSDGYRVETLPHGIAIYGPVPLSQMTAVAALGASNGYDLMDLGVAAALGATFVLTNRAHGEAWRTEIEQKLLAAYPNDPVERWMRGTDTGTSAWTILVALRPDLVHRRRSDRTGVPRDADDIGRCIRLFRLVPELAVRRAEVAAAPGWRGLIEKWDELEALYDRAESGEEGSARRCPSGSPCCRRHPEEDPGDLLGSGLRVPCAPRFGRCSDRGGRRATVLRRRGNRRYGPDRVLRSPRLLRSWRPVLVRRRADLQLPPGHPGFEWAPSRGVRLMFIVIEGLDGAGTTTQTALLAERLRASGRVVHTTREPTGGLFAADRADHLAHEIEPALARGETVISDRYIPSSLAYQSLTLPLERVFALNADFRVPDLTLFLEVPVDTCLLRIASRPSQEIFEERRQLEKIAQSYQQVFDFLRSRGERIVRIDGTASPGGVLEELVQEAERLGSRLSFEASWKREKG